MSSRPELKTSLLREPLVHFLIGGLLIFLVSSWRGEEVDAASRRITISAEQVSRLAMIWQQTWQRPPSPAELDGLIRDDIKEEVYYREAMRLGLADDDLIIRRRLRTKMEFLANAALENAAPTDAILQAWLDKNPARYAPATAYSFDQVYIGQGGSGAAGLKAKLDSGADWKALGAPLDLPRSVDAAERASIARDFGEGFADALARTKPGAWAGPVESGFGLHLIRVRTTTTPPKPRLADVRKSVENDWRAATLKEREAKAYQALLDGYMIKIEKP